VTGVHQAIAGSSRLLSVPKIEAFTSASSAGADGVNLALPPEATAGRYLVGAIATNSGLGADIGTVLIGGQLPDGLNRTSAGTFSFFETAIFRRALTGAESGALTADLPGSSVRYAAFMFIVSGGVAFSSTFGRGVSSSGTTIAPTDVYNSDGSPAGTNPFVIPAWGLAAPSLFYSILAHAGEGPHSISWPSDYTLLRETVTSGDVVNLSVCARRAITASEDGNNAAITRSATSNGLVSHLRAIQGG
jgi:hypothetical protein